MTEDILYLDNRVLTVYRYQARQLEKKASFQADPASVAAFTSYLAASRSASCALLVNSAEEAYVQQEIPRLNRRDQENLIRRKCHQHFPDTDFSCATKRKLPTGNRHGAKVVISALLNAAELNQWLACIERTGTAFSGLYTLPQLAGPLLRRLGIDTERCLFLAVLPHAIRQIYLLDGEVAFARQVSIRDPIAISPARLAGEAKTLHEYLLSQQLIERDTPLPVHLLPASALHPETLSQLPQGERLRFSILEPQGIAQQLNLALPGNGLANDMFFLAQLGRARPKEQWAPDKFRQAYQAARNRRLISQGGLGSLLGCLVFSGIQLYQAHAMAQEIDLLNKGLQQLAQSERQQMATLPNLGIDLSTLLELDRQYRAIPRHSPLPREIYQTISRAMAAEPQITLDEIDWHTQPINPARSIETTSVRGQAADSTALIRFIRHLEKNAGLSITREPIDQATRPSPTFQLRLRREIAP